MMNNLFSSFDPSINNSNLWFNWVSIITFILVIPFNYWLIKSKLFIITTYPLKFMINEASILLKKTEKMNSIIYCSLFFFIIINNFMGLFPYIFTGTSHLSMNLSIAITLWSSIMIYSILNKTKHLLAHLVPTGTPPLLMSFMVMIETISSIIRPIALSVRLTANMVAGHLLLTLMGTSSSNSSVNFIFIIITTQMMLVILEMAVSLIQAYVFSVLVILYASEI